MSRTHTQVIYTRLNHLPTPDELTYRTGPATVVTSETTPAGVDVTKSTVELYNLSGKPTADHSISNPSDGKLQLHSQLYTKQVRSRWTGEIIGTYDRVYNWTKRSITYLTRDTLIVNGVRYDINPQVGESAGRPSDTSDGRGPVNRSTTVHFPFDVEVYDPDNASDMLGPNIDYTVQFVTWDGQVITTQLVKPGGTAVSPPPPIRPGNTFISWSDDFVNVQRDMIIRPIYSNDELTVSWLNWDGVILKTELVTFGQSANPPADPSKVGHSFSGWDIDYGFIGSDTVITAQFTPNMMNVTFIDWDDYVISSQLVPYGSPAALVIDPIREHYVFTGWDHDITAVTVDTIARATYEIMKFFVSYIDSLTEAVLKTEEVPYGQPGTPPAWPWSDDVYYDAFVFIGWNYSLTEITDSFSTRAVFEDKIISVIVNDDCTGKTIKVYRTPYGSEFSEFQPPDHSDIGLEFDGWQAAGDGNLVYMTNDTRVLAKYTQMWLLVTFLAENGALSTPPEVAWTQRIRYSNSQYKENLGVVRLSSADGTMYVENWYYVNRATNRMEVFGEHTEVYHDIVAYPRFKLNDPEDQEG